MNTGLLLEVLISSFLLLSVVAVFTLHYFSLSRLLLNEKEGRRILHLLAVSQTVMENLSVFDMGIRLPNVVDCSRLRCNGNIYVRCGPFSCGKAEGKLLVRRPVVYNGIKTYLVVGIP